MSFLNLVPKNELIFFFSNRLLITVLAEVTF